MYEFDRVIGAKYGKPSKWVRVEETRITGGVEIHGHPITKEEYLDAIK